MIKDKPTVHRLNTIRPVANKTELKLTRNFRQPTTSELASIVKAVVEHELHEQADEATRAATHKLAACFDGAYPFHLRYERHVKTAEISVAQFEKHVPYWDKLSPKKQQEVLKLTASAMRENISELKEMGKFLEHQQNIMKSWTDTQIDMIGKIQEHLGIS